MLTCYNAGAQTSAQSQAALTLREMFVFEYTVHQVKQAV